MDKTTTDKIAKLEANCSCGSGKPASNCHSKGDWIALMKSKCSCGSGKMMRDCCAKDKWEYSS